MSAVKSVPDGYHNLQPYIMLRNCTEAMAFYTKVFGATERLCMKNKDGRVGHAEIQLGDSVLMMADENEQMQAFSPEHYGGSPISLMLYVEDCDATYQKALDAGAKSLREPADQFYGDRTAGFLDPFGYTWWVGTHIKDVSPEELEAAAAQK